MVTKSPILARAALLALACLMAIVVAAWAMAADPAGATVPAQNGKIAFVSLSGVDGEELDLYTMNADGSAPTKIVSGDVSLLLRYGRSGGYPDFSPDGSKIFFTSNSAELKVVNADGTDQKTLAEWGLDPALSPDGSKIAFSRSTDGVYLMNSDGGGIRRLDESGLRYPEWSPDGSRIAFYSLSTDTENHRRYRITVMNSDGGGRVVRGAAGLLRPRGCSSLSAFTWSPNGSKIVFVGQDADCQKNIYVMDPSDGGLTNLTDDRDPSGSSHEVPTWSPDGSKIFFESNSRTFVMNADGGTITDITPKGLDSAWGPYIWSPDGSKVAFPGSVLLDPNTGETRRYIYAMNPDGTGVKRLTDDEGYGTDVMLVDWAPLEGGADNTAPTVTKVKPAPKAEDVAPDANLYATFSEKMKAATINAKTFKLHERGSSARLVTGVTYNASTKTAKLDPDEELRDGARYRVVVTSGAEDRAGNPLDQNPAVSGNQPKAWRFTAAE